MLFGRGPISAWGCTWSSCYTSSAAAHHLLLWPAHCLGNQLPFLCAAMPYHGQYPTRELKYTIWCLWQFRLGYICNSEWKAHTPMKAKEDKKQNSVLLSRKIQLCPALTSIYLCFYCNIYFKLLLQIKNTVCWKLPYIWFTKSSLFQLHCSIFPHMSLSPEIFPFLNIWVHWL